MIGAQSYVTQYAYDLADRVTQMVYPSGRIVDYGRDALGRVADADTRANALATPVALASGLTYEAFGGLDALAYGNGVTLALGHDLNGRMVAMDAFNGGTAVLDLDYTFDLAGNITDIDDTGLGVRGRNYAYDALHRLTSAQELASGGSPVTLQTDYTYDAVGNRLTRDAGGALETYSYDAFSNRQNTVTAGGETRTYHYTDTGNVDVVEGSTSIIVGNGYNNANRLSISFVEQSISNYYYDGRGQRVYKAVSGLPTPINVDYVYDLGGNLIAEVDLNMGAVSAEYVWLDGMPLAYIQGGAVYFVHADHLGTPQRLTDAAAAVVWDASYRPFGEATVTGALTFNLRFPGQYEDAETGLHYNYFRDYDPTTGRYIQSDPIGLRGGWNTYAYVGGNPVMFVDPRGLKARVCCRKIPFAFGARHCFIDSDVGGQKAAWAVQGNTRGPASTWGEATWDDPFDDRDASDTVCGDWTDNCSVDGCVAKEVTGYPGKTVYVFQWGPNSNTFAGIVARRCDLKKPAGAWAPGWDVTSPAPPYKPYPPYSRPEK